MPLQVDELTAELEAARARLAGAPELEDRAFAAERARVEVRVPRSDSADLPTLPRRWTGCLPLSARGGARACSLILQTQLGCEHMQSPLMSV